MLEIGYLCSKKQGKEGGGFCWLFPSNNPHFLLFYLSPNHPHTTIFLLAVVNKGYWCRQKILRYHPPFGKPPRAYSYLFNVPTQQWYVRNKKGGVFIFNTARLSLKWLGLKVKVKSNGKYEVKTLGISCYE